MKTGSTARELWSIGEIRDMLSKEFDQGAEGAKNKIKMKRKKKAR